MKAVMAEVDAFQLHVNNMKNICYRSLHQTYYEAYTKLKNRMSNAHYMDNAKRINKINLLMKQFLSKASELLNRHVDNGVIQSFKDEYPLVNFDKISKNVLGRTIFKPESLLNKSDIATKTMWAFIRFHKRIDYTFTDNESKQTLKKELKAKQANSHKFSIYTNSAYVLEAYEAECKLEQRRRDLKDAYTRCAHEIVPQVIDFVGNGVLEVCNEFQSNVPDARFLFATRRVTYPIREIPTDRSNPLQVIPRGTMVGTVGKLQIIDQQTNVFYDIMTEQQKTVNLALRNGTTRHKMHGIEIRLNLSQLLTYLVPTHPMPYYKTGPYKEEDVYADLLSNKKNIRPRVGNQEARQNKRARTVTDILTQ